MFYLRLMFPCVILLWFLLSAIMIQVNKSSVLCAKIEQKCRDSKQIIKTPQTTADFFPAAVCVVFYGLLKKNYKLFGSYM